MQNIGKSVCIRQHWREGRVSWRMGEAERDDDLEVQIGNKLRRDAFLVFRALCKLSMKTPPKEASADPQLMKGKIVALELLKILLENAGAVFRTSERWEKNVPWPDFVDRQHVDLHLA
ncbi:brefeldin A-inhibited guanine nucleotide-exchange protein 2-like [Neltuma alba]|uniref:brefeldin A-inhibited guanine nucleotide-exchange protein 2-like n=1 Tax=Neltuma alba TaxID=207710 RepID=UPI0010A54DD1|nr:brefeldin A-inhibited guanine nucleotide-exchange protein 2-like [Prosopis alba]